MIYWTISIFTQCLHRAQQDVSASDMLQSSGHKRGRNTGKQSKVWPLLVSRSPDVHHTNVWHVADMRRTFLLKFVSVSCGIPVNGRIMLIRFLCVYYYLFFGNCLKFVPKLSGRACPWLLWREYWGKKVSCFFQKWQLIAKYLKQIRYGTLFHFVFDHIIKL